MSSKVVSAINVSVQNLSGDNMRILVEDASNSEQLTGASVDPVSVVENNVPGEEGTKGGIESDPVTELVAGLSEDT
ncbi:hypothetical protein CDL15_Pgr023316 [Punica granatum]|uniref:Uncharacterized protein n=1 Tax=Punica granatum TaxID=22663 RepID=A0A218Y128_PUNGR|nr:hypothetical protein CDL15_Pgr023316 [Punica granatum]